MKLFTPTLCMLLGLSSSVAVADSLVTLRLQADYDALAQWIEQEVPRVLHESPARKETCVEAERVCTKIPELRGSKIYSRTECVDVSPRISCDISESVTRSGNIELSGEGSTLVLSETIAGSATVKGRGAIGRHIRQTVRGTARVTARLSASLNSDWSPDGALDISHRWIERPVFNVLGIIPITVGTEADRVIDREAGRLDTLVDRELAELDLRSEVDRFWQSVQEPMALAAGEAGAELYLHIRPEVIAFSGLDFSDDSVTAAAAIKGQIRIMDDEQSPWADRSSLPALSDLSSDASGFSVNVPVSVGMQTLNQLVIKELPLSTIIRSLTEFKVTVNAMQFSSVDDRLQVAMALQVFRGESSGALYDDEAVFSARPVWNSEAETLVMDDIRLESGISFWLRPFIKAAHMTGLIERSVDVSLQRELAAFKDDLSASLDRSLGQGLSVSGDVSGLEVRDLVVEDGLLRVSAVADGELDLVFDLSD